MLMDLARATGRDDRPSIEMAARAPRILVFDSGLGGLTVLSEIRKAVYGADIVFVADDAVFPYGALAEPALVARVSSLMRELVAAHRPDLVVIACNTASTAVLPPLRAEWPEIAFVGTVPAIKPAAAQTRSGLISVLATPGTVARDYTRDLVRSFAGACEVNLVGAPRLAGLVEMAMRGEAIADAAIAAEIAPTFVQKEARRTDAIVLACTHFPLLLDRLRALAPWPVMWIDPAPAIARRVSDLLRLRADLALSPGRDDVPMPIVFTSRRAPGATLSAFLAVHGLVWRDGHEGHPTAGSTAAA